MSVVKGAAPPPVGEFREVDGRRLWMDRAGGGDGPAVVILPGGGAVGLDYWNVHEQAAAFTTSVLYDRGGAGWSDRGVALPRSMADVVAELRALLAQAGVPGPCVFVGHSLGGLYARYLAARFPAEVAGLVLIEPGDERYRSYMPGELVERWKAWAPGKQELPAELPVQVVDFYRGLFGQQFAQWPTAISQALVANHVRRDWLQVGLSEASNLDALYDELRAAGQLPDVPLIVLTGTAVDDFKRAVSGGVSEQALLGEVDGKRRLYNELAKSVPRGENRLIEGVGHVTLTLRRADTVAQAVRDVLALGSG